MTWLLLVILGFLAFAAGVMWFAATVALRRPIQRFPGGAGLLVLAVLGLIVLTVGLRLRPDAGAGVEQEEAAPNGDSELRAELAEIRGQLGTVRRDLDAVAGRMDDAEEAISVLAQAASATPPEAPEEAVASPAAGQAPVAIAGPVRAHSNEALDAVDSIEFRMRNRSESIAFPLIDSGTRIVYYDSDQGTGAIAFREVITAEVVNVWSVRWIDGEGPNLGPGEEVEITVSLLGLDPRLTAGKEFAVGVELPGQPALDVIRVIPDALDAVMELGPEDRG